MIEHEKKYMLNEAQFEYLKSTLFFSRKAFIQKNHYYDNAAIDFNKAGITCRIREKCGIFTATVKTRNCGDAYTKLEQSSRAENENDTTAFAGMNVILYGCLETERRIIKRFEGIEIALDKNTYLGITDYELEVEYDRNFERSCDEVIIWIYAVLSASKLISPASAFDESPMSKSERFFKILNERN